MSRFTVLLISSILLVLYHPRYVYPLKDDSTTIILRPPHAGSNRHTMFLPLFPFPPNSSRISGDEISRRHLQKSDTPRPNARMALHDDLLLNGYYTTRLWIGSPPQRFALIVDTGSTVTYVPCSTCEQCGKHQDPKFDPELSSTYKPVKCNIDCTCDNNREQCVYERQYAEMSSSSGALGEDIISFGNQSDLHPQRAVFGCENVETGDLYSQHADGIMGLGRGDLSIVDQLVDGGVISDSFSLCYGGMDVGGGAMVLGGISPPAEMVYSHSDPVRRYKTSMFFLTKIHLSRDGNSPYYNIELKELHVAGKRLPLNPSVFDGKHGTVLDSGTTYAYLPEAAFLAFKQAIMKELHGVRQIKGPDPSYNDICFSGTKAVIVPGELLVQALESYWSILSWDFSERKGSDYSFRRCFTLHPLYCSLSALSPQCWFRFMFLVSFVFCCFKVYLYLASLSAIRLLCMTANMKRSDFGKLTVLMYGKDFIYLIHHLKVLLHQMDQVHLTNYTSKGNDYLTSWSISPPKSIDHMSKETASSIISRIAEGGVHLPDSYGKYRLYNWDIQPPTKRRRQQSSLQYKPVDLDVPEQELQPL
ncbi:Aspartic peptidase [Cynara cardunculus var. scolymus]|uniref:Aspartic peptidase n=1 Tax=Cynara cardunculus var. scolymus TaxID=59895 RepID=A0A103XKJ0_CYNCS|nr:Aspartic peptidase [Cynara cardunculus var. scolymus]